MCDQERLGTAAVASENRTLLGRARLAATLGLFLGFVGFSALIIYYGAGEIISAAATIGWGLLVVSGFYAVILATDTFGWRTLLASGDRPAFVPMLWMRWVCGAINRLLPVAQVGGDFVRAQLLSRRYPSASVAGATVMVDVTAGVFTLIAFAATGVLLVVGKGAVDGHITGSLTTGLAVFGLLIAAFYAAQRGGVFLALAHALERIGGDQQWHRIAGGAKVLDSAIVTLYRDRAAVFRCCGLRLLAWCLGAVDIWLMLYFLDTPVSLVDAFAIEAVTQAVIAAGFAIPGALGVQDGGFVIVGALLGLTPETALALSLVKRVRDIVVGVPALLTWQTREGHRRLGRSGLWLSKGGVGS